MIWFRFTPFTPYYTDVGQALNVGFLLKYKAFLGFTPIPLLSKKRKNRAYIALLSV